MGAAPLGLAPDDPLEDVVALEAAVVAVPEDDLLEEPHAVATNAPTTMSTAMARMRDQLPVCLTPFPSVS